MAICRQRGPGTVGYVAVADICRLITTLTDHRAFAAAALVRLYHERWEIESAYLALRHTLLDGRVLARAIGPASSRNCGRCSPDASCAWPWSPRWRTRPGTVPHQASFTTALEAARRLRCSARKVKCATSRYLNRDDGGRTRPPPSPRSTAPYLLAWPGPQMVN
jgi:hypothetical protein